jgi:mRNA interferase HicA
MGGRYSTAEAACIGRRLFPTKELQRLLASHGCKFETHRGGSGHITVRRGERRSQIPMHGGGKELGKGLVQKILKDLGLK